MRALRWLLLVIALSTTACAEASPDRAGSTASTALADAQQSDTAGSPEPVTEPDDVSPVEVLGDPTQFGSGTNGATALEVAVNGRECVLSDTLFGSCRASTGTGGQFVVTAEGSVDDPSRWNVVVRCGLKPARPAAVASGQFTPVTTDLGLTPYGEVVGVTLRSSGSVEAALVYQPDGADCPVVWGLGEVGSDSLFTGGTDALNGEDAPVYFTDAAGARVCAVADGQGGVSTGTPGDATTCRT